MKINILGAYWKIAVLDSEVFLRRFDEELAGITLPQTKQIFINAEDLNFITIAHEIFHAAVDGLCLSAAGLSTDQIEEVHAELFAYHGPSLLRLSRNVLPQLRKAA